MKKFHSFFFSLYFPRFFSRRHRILLRLGRILFLLFLGGSGVYLSGRVIEVADGDTVVVFTGGRMQRIRLYGVDCPELQQRGGREAMAFTRSSTLLSEIKITVFDTDAYGREVALLTLSDGSTVNEELIRNGHAWVYNRYCSTPECSRWRTLEREARERKVGLWREQKPVPPWIWRQKQ